MQIFLIRHARPRDIDGLCYGRVDVTVEKQLMVSTAKSIVTQIPGRALADARVYCSPLSRCLGLARHIASPCEPTLTDDLAEMSFGRWEGVAWNAVPRDQLDAWANDLWNYRPGGGESADMVASRWERWLNHVRQSNGGTVVAVTHAGVIRVALARSGHLKSSSAIVAPIPFGSVYRLNLA